MDVIDERALVYAALLAVCSTLAVFTCPFVAAIAFVWVLASIEVAYWAVSYTHLTLPTKA